MTSDLARNAYQQVEVGGANGLQLVVMLYEGAIRFLGNAKDCIQNRDLHGKAVAIDRALAIVGELQSTLKFEEGGELAPSLDKLYTYMTERILEGSLQLNVKPLEEVIKLLKILNSGWAEIAGRSKQETPLMPSAPEMVEWNRELDVRQPLELFG